MPDLARDGTMHDNRRNRSASRRAWLTRSSADATWSSAVLVGAAAATGGVNLIFGLIVAKIGGELTWSAVAPLLAAGTAGSFAGLGLEYAVTRAVASGHSPRQALRVGRTPAIALLAATVVSVLWAAPIAHFFHLSADLPVPLSTALFAVTVLSALPSGLLVGNRRFAALATISVTAAFARIALLAVPLGGLVTRALWCSVAVTVAGAVAMLAAGWNIPARAGHGGLVKPFALTGSFAQVVLWLTVLAPVAAARHFLPLREAGELATVTFVASSLSYLAGPVATAFFPVMLADHSTRLVRNGLIITLFITVLGTFGLMLVGPEALTLLYHTSQRHLPLLILFAGLAVTAQASSGFLVWAALARNHASRAIGFASVATVPLIGLLALWHSTGATLLVASLPSTCVLGLVAATVIRRDRCSTEVRKSYVPSAARPIAMHDHVSSGPTQMPGFGPGGGVAGVGCSATHPVSVGIMAYNEERTIATVLDGILRQPPGLATVDEVVVVASGCTDGTTMVVEEIARRDERVRLIAEPNRAGKLAAVRRFLAEARNDVVVISGADTLLEDGALHELCGPLLTDSSVGMVGPRVVPIEGRAVGHRLHRVLWDLHDIVARSTPKLGEVVAVRKSACGDLPAAFGCDEVVMESAVVNLGLRLVYAPTAVVHNRGPVSVREYVMWRRRLAIQHRAAQHGLRYTAATTQVGRCVAAVVLLLRHRPTAAGWLICCIACEAVARWQGWRSYRHGDHQVIWQQVSTSRDGALSAA
jgi:O-antigen/teichoic acid export membrane protein/GT2 family glycosyltransferase